MLEVWGRATSSNVQVVMWAAAELGLEVTRHDRGHVHGGLDAPEFLAMNPNGRIPVVRDAGGPPIWESAAILRYLGARHGDAAFWPADPARRAQLDMWAEWVKTTFVPVFANGVFWQMVRLTAAERDEGLIARSLAELPGVVGLLEARLAEDDWLGGRSLSFADVMLGHHLYRYHTLDFARPEAPRLAAYYARLTERPAYAEHVMVSYDVLRAAG